MKESDRLTEHERAFAEQNHELIYKFLNQERLPESEFYDIVAWGYLKAVQRYHREPKLKEYSFSTIAWYAMRCRVGNKRRADRIRDAMIAFSINEQTEDGTEYGDFIQDAKDAFRELEQEEDLQELLDKLMPALTDRQRRHVVSTLKGYKPTEIIHKERIRVQDFHQDTKAIQSAARKALPEIFCGGGVLLEIRIGRWRKYGKIPA